MAKKKKKAPQLEAWCWYCDREFEDDKVLLQHQKAKHYRCPQCPRRLNTAGGLAVHLTQVHKAEPDRLDNTLPGRDTFDIEIYGMAGIPEKDLLEWKTRKAAAASRSGASGFSGQPTAKRPRIEKFILTTEQLRVQLEAHKALMGSDSLTSGADAGSLPGAPPFGVPPPAAGIYSRPPPNVPPPGFRADPSNSASAHPPAHPYAPSAVPPPFGQPAGSPDAHATKAAAPSQPSPHQMAVRSGVKSRMVYADSALSPEEKLAKMGKYSYADPDDKLVSTKAEGPSSDDVKAEVKAEPSSPDQSASMQGSDADAGQSGRSGRKTKASDLF